MPFGRSGSKSRRQITGPKRKIGIRRERVRKGVSPYPCGRSIGPLCFQSTMNEEHLHPADAAIVNSSSVVRPLSTLGFLFYILHGIGVTLGLSLFWGLEVVRNNFFRLLDRMNMKARVRKASPFPPGQPRKRALTEASR
jgi:hypothetical protein